MELNAERLVVDMVDGYHFWLVVCGLNPSEKDDFVNWDDYSQPN